MGTKKKTLICTECFENEFLQKELGDEAKAGTRIQQDNNKGPWYCYDCGEDMWIKEIKPKKKK